MVIFLMDSTMRALTILQPYATALAIALKLRETRSWATSYRGTIAIHAGKSHEFMGGDAEWYMNLQSAKQIGEHAFGAVIAVADLVDVWPTEKCIFPHSLSRGKRYELTTADHLLGDWSPGRYAWEFKNMRKLKEPVPTRGYQGLWTPDEATLKAVLDNLLPI